MPHPPILRPELGEAPRCPGGRQAVTPGGYGPGGYGPGLGMAPWLTKNPTSQRSKPVRPSGDLESQVPIWNGEATPSSGSNMRFPNGDAGIIDDCSYVLQSPEEKAASIDQEKTLGLIMSGRVGGVTSQRLSSRKWEAYGADELFVPLPCPDDNDCQDDQGWNANSWDNGKLRPCPVPLNPFKFEVPAHDGGAICHPSPTSPDRPGSELPGHSLARFPLGSSIQQVLGSMPLPSAHDHGALVLPVPDGSPIAEPPRPEWISPPSAPALVLEERSAPPTHYRSEEQPTLQRQASITSANGRKMKKSVSFSNLDSAKYEVVPYSEVYGDHPKNFHFDAQGNKVSPMQARMAEFKAQWGYEQQPYGGQGYDGGNDHDRWGYNDQNSEPLF